MQTNHKNYTKELESQNALLEAIRQMQNNYFKQGINYGWCEETLKNLLLLTESEFGFICELQHEEDGTQYLKSHIITNISWNDETRKFYEANKEKGLKFFNFESIWGQVIKTGKPYISDDPDNDQNKGGYPKKSGHPHLKKFLGIPIKCSDNKVIGIMAVANNPNGYTLKVAKFLEPFVTTYGILMEKERLKKEDKKREKEILKNRIELNTWLSNSPICTKKVDLDFNLQYMSEAGIRELKVGDVNKFYNAPYPFYFFPEPIKKLMSSKLEEVKETGEITQIDGILSDMEGNKMWYNHMLVPVKDHEGKLDYILILSTDISDRKNAEIKLQSKNEEYEAINEEIRQSNEALLAAKEKIEESEEKLLEAQELSHVGSWEYIIESDIVKWSKELYNIFERSHDLPAPVYSEQRTYYTEESFSLLDKSVQDSIQHEKPYEIELDIITSSGTVRQIISKGNIKKDKHNKIISLYGTAQDITKQKKIEQELRNAKEKAEESNNLKTEFLRNMSHEIRTPLNGIMGFAEMLNNPNISPEKQKNYTTIIRNSGQQLLRIIDDILEISELETKQRKLEETEFCLNQLLTEQFAIFNLRSVQKKVPIYLEKPLHDKQVLILSDKTKLNKILSNLIENAIKFTTTGSIEIGYFIENELLKLYVKDTGIGISPENQEKIFERFSQGGEDIAGTYGGLGLGLSICKENAQLLGGDIMLESEKGSGSTFIVTIPYKAACKETPDNNRTINKYPTGNKTKTILVAEDEAVNYMYLEALFEDELETDFNLIHARNGKEALDICLENQNIDIVLMDIKMPVMNGNLATQQIKKEFPDLPVIAQTAYSTESEKAEAMRHGYDDFMSKPLEKEKLFALVNKYANNK